LGGHGAAVFAHGGEASQAAEMPVRVYRRARPWQRTLEGRDRCRAAAAEVP